jgi:hypothetical protein
MVVFRRFRRGCRENGSDFRVPDGRLSVGVGTIVDNVKDAMNGQPRATPIFAKPIDPGKPEVARQLNANFICVAWRLGCPLTNGLEPRQVGCLLGIPEVHRHLKVQP